MTNTLKASLINSGLVKQIKYPSYEPISERRLIQAKGKPISETIIQGIECSSSK